MAEWLTHVLVAYARFTVVSWTVAWLDRQWVAVAMVGAILPDLNRLQLVVPAETVTALIGLPFLWDGLHTLAGAVLLSAIGALLFDTTRRRIRAFLLLFAGSSRTCWSISPSATPPATRRRTCTSIR